MSVEFQAGAPPPGRARVPGQEEGPAEYRTVHLILNDGRTIPYRLVVGHELRFSDLHFRNLQAALRQGGGLRGFMVTPPEFLP